MRLYLGLSLLLSQHEPTDIHSPVSPFLQEVTIGACFRPGPVQGEET